MFLLSLTPCNTLTSTFCTMENWQYTL